MTADVTRVAADDPALAPLIDAHLALMRASSPACSIHAMEATDLTASGATMVAIIGAGQAMAMGALKPLSGSHGELKSMHVARDHRGRGLADAILRHLLDMAREQGMTRVSLETGSRPVFAPAVAFYRRHGFEDCPPFEGYVEDPESRFMTRGL